MSTKTSNVPRWKELAAAAALGSLDASERAEVRELPSTQRRAFDELQDDLELAAGEIAALAFADTTDEMPSSIRARLVAPERPRIEPAPVRRSRSWSWLAVAAALVVALLGWWRLPAGTPAVGHFVAKRVLDAPHARTGLLGLQGTRRLDWKATADDDAKGATGDVVWHDGLQQGYMRIGGLRPNDPARSQYQLWIFDAARDDKYPVDGGVFDVTAEGEVVIPIKARLHVGTPTLFAVTVEPPGGVVVSKRERIVLTAAAGG